MTAIAGGGGVMRRFYSQVEAVPVAGGLEIRLDDRPVRTPARARLVLPAAALAEAVAEEWAAQGESLAPETMPLTQLANTALDRVAPEPEAAVAGVVARGRMESLCYQADSPADLVARQEAVWGPLLAWARDHLDVPLEPVPGIGPRPQPEAALSALEGWVAALDPWRLTALQNLAALTDSAVIPLALLRGRLTLEAAFEAAQLEALHQAARWGEDPEAAARRRALKSEMETALRFLMLLA